MHTVFTPVTMPMQQDKNLRRSTRGTSANANAAASVNANKHTGKAWTPEERSALKSCIADEGNPIHNEQWEDLKLKTVKQGFPERTVKVLQSKTSRKTHNDVVVEPPAIVTPAAVMVATCECRTRRAVCLLH
jgi:hypothetical protein